VENARLYEEARGKAALDERQKLARELHDSVSQAPFAIELNASVADELVATAPERASGLVNDVVRLAELGLTEVRGLIFELRPESLEQEGLVGALEEQAAAVQARHGIRVRLDLAREPAVPMPTKEALYRMPRRRYTTRPRTPRPAPWTWRWRWVRRRWL
jgi:signal transduction histidine kinase